MATPSQIGNNTSPAVAKSCEKKSREAHGHEEQHAVEETIEALKHVELQQSGDVDVAFDKVEEALEHKMADLRDIKVRARAGLIHGLRNGELEKIASDMEAAERAIEQQKEDLKAIKLKAKQGLLKGTSFF